MLCFGNFDTRNGSLGVWMHPFLEHSNNTLKTHPCIPEDGNICESLGHSPVVSSCWCVSSPSLPHYIFSRKPEWFLSLSLSIYIYIYKQCMGDNSYSTLVLEPYNIIIHYWIDRYIIDKHWLILHGNDIPLFGKNNCFSSKTFIGEISSYMSCTPLCINSY